MSDKIREEFEASNPIPEGVIRYGDGYILHTIGTLSPAFSFIKAGEFIAKFAGYVEGWKAALAQQPAPVAVPDGFRLVPVEPTPEMVEAYSLGKHRVLPAYVGAKEKADARVVERYRAMLAAAPAAPVAVGQEPIKLSDDVREFLQEWIDSATGGEDADVDYDFANQLAVLLGPIYTAPPAAEQPDAVKVDREFRNTLERAASALEGRMCPTACASETSCCMPDVRDSARELRALLAGGEA